MRTASAWLVSGAFWGALPALVGCDDAAREEAPAPAAPAPAAPAPAAPAPAAPAAEAPPREPVDSPLVAAPVSVTDDGPPLIVLDLAAGERLLDVIRPKAEAEPESSLLHLASRAGELLFAGGQRSRVWDAVSAPRFLGDSGVALAEVRVGKTRGFAVWNGQTFVESALYDAVRGFVPLSDGRGGFAFIGVRGERERVVRHDGRGFVEVAEGVRVGAIEPSPDGRVVRYAFTAERPLWGVDARHYVAQPRWFDLGEGHVAYVGETAAGAEVVVDHEVAADHAELGAVLADSARGQLAWAGRTGDDWKVHLATPAAASPRASVGGLPAPPRALRFHAASGLLQAVAPVRGGGERLIVGVSGGGLDATAAWRAVKLEDVPFVKAPLATATSDAGTVVLTGATPGRAWTKVERLVATHRGQGFLYVATDAAGVRAVDAEREHPVFRKIGELRRTDGDQPVYVGEGENMQRLVINGQAAPEVLSVEQVILREGDGVAWLARIAGGQAVGLEMELGETFASIGGLRFSRTGVLWYDGERAGLRHRVLEAEVGEGYALLGPLVETALSAEVAWIGRAVTLTGEAAEGRDDVVVGGKVLARRPFAVSGPDARRALDVKDLAILRTVPESDAVLHVGRHEGGVGVGRDAVLHGPFEALRDVLPTPDGLEVAFLSRRGGTWAAQVGATRHDELTDASGLRFSPDGREVRHEGVKDGVKYTFVGRDAFLAVKEERTSPDGSAWAFAGQQADGWHVSASAVGEAARATSEAWEGVETIRWAVDGFGVDAIVARGPSRHLLRKPAGRPFAALAGWAKVGLPRDRHAPYAAVALSEVKGGRVPAAGLASLPPAGLFVAIGRSPEAFEATLRVRAVDADGVTVEGALPDLEPDGRTVWIMPFEAPFTYPVTRGTTQGEVFREVFYRKIEPRGFTAHRRWLAVGRDEVAPPKPEDAKADAPTPKPVPADSLILGDRVVALEGRVGDLLGHPDTERDALDTTAVSVTRGATTGWVLVDAEARKDELGQVARLGLAQWTDLSPRGEHTLVWAGEDRGEDFQAVGAERYDSVRDVRVTPKTGALAFIGRRGQEEAVWAHGRHGGWYSQVRELSFQGPSDTPVHIAEHDYGHAPATAEAAGLPVERVAVLPARRRLAAIVHGDRRTTWRDAVGHLVPRDTLEATVHTAAEDGRWALYAGDAASEARYEEIGWFVRTIDEVGELHTHFLARDAEGWVEVHDGVTGARVDAVRLERLTDVIPAGLSAVPRAPGGADAAVLVDREGRFDYVGLVGDAQVFVHQGTPSAPVRAVDRVWYFADGATVAARVKDGARVRLAVNGKVSEAYAAIGDPVHAPATGDVHAVADVALPDAVGEALQAPVAEASAAGAAEARVAQLLAAERAELARVKAADLSWDGVRQVVLKNGEAVAQAWQVVGGLSVVGRGTAATLLAGGQWRLYYNGAVGEATAGIGETPAPIFRDSLADSRVVVALDGQLRVAGAEPLPQVYDRVSSLFRAKLGGAEVTVSVGRSGLIEHLHLNDEPQLAAESIRNLGTYGGRLRAEVVDGNLAQFAIGAERFDATATVAGASVTVGEQAWVPLALQRDERRWLREGDAEARPAWAIWDVRGAAVGAEPQRGVRWSWLEGTLDRAAATLTVRKASMELAAGAPSVWGPLVVEPEPAPPVAPSVQPGQPVEVEFGDGVALGEASRRALVEIVRAALPRDALRVVLEPSGDASGYASQSLGRQRSQAVADYLQSRGLPAARIERAGGEGAGVRVTLREPPQKRRQLCGTDDYGDPVYCLR